MMWFSYAGSLSLRSLVRILNKFFLGVLSPSQKRLKLPPVFFKKNELQPQMAGMLDDSISFPEMLICSLMAIHHRWPLKYRSN